LLAYGLSDLGGKLVRVDESGSLDLETRTLSAVGTSYSTVDESVHLPDVVISHGPIFGILRDRSKEEQNRERRGTVQSSILSIVVG